MTGAPSSKTSYVITGEGAGPKKLETIKKLGLETLDEDGFLNLIATRKGVLDKATKEKMKKDEEKVKKEAEEMEAREREEKKQAQKAGDSAKYALALWRLGCEADIQQSSSSWFSTVDIQIRSTELEGNLWQ